MQSTHNFVARKGSWKLAFCPGSGCRTMWGNLPRREEVWEKALKEFGGERSDDGDLKSFPFVQLFDLGSDPTEERNLRRTSRGRWRKVESAVKRGGTTAGPDLKNDRKQVRYWPQVP